MNKHLENIRRFAQSITEQANSIQNTIDSAGDDCSYFFLEDTASDIEDDLSKMLKEIEKLDKESNNE
jgi:hypothetical protein